MTGSKIRQALREGQRVYGSAILNKSAWDVAGYKQLDFAFVDNEHAPLGRESTMAMCQLYKSRGIAPVVRVPVAEPILACEAIDAGAQGIICPYIECPEVLQNMVGAVKYRPLKGEKLKKFLREGTGVEQVTLDYLNAKNQENFLIANIESVPAMERLDEILAVEGLDAVLIGPNDLSISLDIPDDCENPKFIAACEEIIGKARAAGKGAGIHYHLCLEREKHYVEKGANLIVHSADVLEAIRGIDGAISEMRSQFGDLHLEGAGDGEVI